MIIAIWGSEKSWKTTMALSFPKPLFHMDLDVGGFNRAAWKLPKDTKILRCNIEDDISKIDWSQYDIVTKPYPLPIQMEKMMGAKHEGVTIRFPRRVIGYKEIWRQIVIDFVAACKNPLLQSIDPDSATQMWTICHTSLLQEKQEIQISQGMKVEDKMFRERLKPVEFPNSRMRSVIYTARSSGKNLILTHYPKDVYADKVTEKGIEQYKTGAITPDGFKDTQKLVDAVIWIELDDKTNNVTAKFTKCAIEDIGTAGVGLFVEPTYQGILDLQKSMRGEE